MRPNRFGIIARKTCCTSRKVPVRFTASTAVPFRQSKIGNAGLVVDAGRGDEAVYCRAGFQLLEQRGHGRLVGHVDDAGIRRATAAAYLLHGVLRALLAGIDADHANVAIRQSERDVASESATGARHHHALQRHTHVILDPSAIRTAAATLRSAPSSH